MGYKKIECCTRERESLNVFIGDEGTTETWNESIERTTPKDRVMNGCERVLIKEREGDSPA